MADAFELMKGVIGERSNPMNTTATIAAIPGDVKAQLQQTLDDLVKGVRRSDQMKAACERMDRMREDNRKLLGEQNCAVALIRETRDRP